MPSRKILVIGATGKQGSAFICAAVAYDSPSEGPNPNGGDASFDILALTRDASSQAAKSLAALADNVHVVFGDLNDAASIRRVFEDEKAKPEGGIWGVLAVLAFPGLGADPSGELAQGKLVVDMACEYGVQHLVYSSLERGDDKRDGEPGSRNATKAEIERQVKSKCGLRWTILRPAFFMENFDGSLGRITTSLLHVGMKRDTKLQLIAAEDIGHVAFAVMRAPEEYSGQCITVLGDALTAREIEESYERGAGCAMPSVPNALAHALKALNKHARGVVDTIEEVHADRAALGSYDALVARCREIHPGMQTFEDWARARNAGAKWKQGWNGVSLAGLLTGKH